MTPTVIGIILIIFGIIYIIKPDVFNSIIRRKIVFDPRRYSPKKYNIFLRALGVTLIVIGILLLQLKYK